MEEREREREKKRFWEKTRRGTSRKVEMKRRGAEGGCVDRINSHPLCGFHSISVFNGLRLKVKS